MAVSSHSSHNPQEVLLVHKGAQGWAKARFIPFYFTGNVHEERTDLNTLFNMSVQINVPRFCTGSICGWNLFQPLGLGYNYILEKGVGRFGRTADCLVSNACMQNAWSCVGFSDKYPCISLLNVSSRSRKWRPHRVNPRLIFQAWIYFCYAVAILHL